MATSPLFGWSEPDDTDLVKDGAAAIRTLGNAIDTSMGDLLGGTTGQVLSKNSNTNMDFTWVTSDDANAIQNTIVDAKGDLIGATAADTPARLAVGTNGQVLTADSTETTGLKWATPATATSKVVQIVTATYSTEVGNGTTTYADTGLSATITPTSASNKVLVFVSQNGVAKTASNANSGVGIRLMRGGTEILVFANQAAYTASAAGNNVGTVGCEFLDSPATTSATTYKTQFKNALTVSNATVQEYMISSTICLMEVTP